MLYLSIFNQYFYKHIDCEEDDVFITIQNDTPFLTKNNEEDYSNPIDLSDVHLAITMPFRAYENNADEISGNTYVWKFDNNEEEKNFYLKIAKNDLIEAKEKMENQIKEKKASDLRKTILIIVSVLL